MESKVTTHLGYHLYWAKCDLELRIIKCNEKDKEFQMAQCDVNVAKAKVNELEDLVAKEVRGNARDNSNPCEPSTGGMGKE